jgi:hypothetical protein
LRQKYKTWLWDAEFRDRIGAAVSTDGSFRYSVFVTATGKRAVVVVNRNSDKEINVKVKLPDAGKLIAVTPEQPSARPTTGTENVPARSVVVIIEQ